MESPDQEIATSCRDTLSTTAFFPEQIYAPGNQRPNDEKCQSRVKSISHFYLQKDDSVVKGKKHAHSGESYPKRPGTAPQQS